MSAPIDPAPAEQPRRYRILLVVLLAASTLFRLWYVHSGAMNLAGDEAHYWEWSRRLDWSYYSKGPMVAWLIALSTRLGGDSEFFVRLPAVLLAPGTALVTFWFARELFHSERAAFIAVLIIGAIPLYAAGSILMTIDAPQMFFWALAVVSLWHAVGPSAAPRGGGGHAAIGWWLLFGASVGLGFLSKYTILFVPAAAASLLTFSRSARDRVRSRDLCASVVVAALLCAPVLIWNARHGWVSIRHVAALTGVMGARGERPAIATFFDFVGSQLGVISPLLLVAIALALGRAARRAFRDCSEQYLFLFMFSAPVLAFFVLWSLHEKIEGNWAAPAYWTASIALAGIWNERAARATALFRPWIWPSMVLLPGFLIIAVGHFPRLLTMAGVEVPPRLDPALRLQGWRALGDAVSEVERSHAGGVPLASESYQIASELAFYVAGHPRVYNLNLGRRMNQYDIWDELNHLAGKDLMMVTGGEPQLPAAGLPFCGATRIVRVVRTQYLGQPGPSFSIFDCAPYKGSASGTVARSY